MKKNIFSDNESGKSSKGFYAALGISAVMIGSACFFAYNEGEKLDKNNLSAESQNSLSEEAVDKKSTDVPKLTTQASTSSAVRTTTVMTTTAAMTETTAHAATLPAASISVSEPPAAEQPGSDPSVEETAAEKLVNVSAPLADMSSVINPFSGTELVKNETTGSWQTHNGTDIAAEVGTEVFAVSPGEVTAVNEDPLWGITVIIDHHNGYISRYCSLAKDLSVQEGDSVVSGDVIGVTGDTADIESALEPHLHIEIMHNGSYQDPMSFFNS